MVMLRKNYSIYYLNIGRVYPTVKGFVVTFPLDKTFYNIICITSAYNFYLFETVSGDTTILRSS